MKILEHMGLSFDDVLLVPQKSSISSRFSGEINLTTTLVPKINLKYPIISSNMDTVTENAMSEEMCRLGGLGIIHRFLSIEKQKELLLKIFSPKILCIGVGKEEYVRFQNICSNVQISAILIDVAHGHSDVMLKQIERIKSISDIPIIAGNVATYHGVFDLLNAGVYSVKCGVGPGSLCSTRIQTGCGVPQLTAIMEAKRALDDFCLHKQLDFKPTIIADGGIRNSGDCVKSFAAGADAIMIGNLFAATDETPGELIRSNGKVVKVYRGMACYSHDTEILTKCGWKFIKNLTKSEEIATLNQHNNTLEYQKIDNLFAYKYCGKMLCVNNRFIDLCVTPNHNMYVAKRSRINDGYKRTFKFVPANELCHGNIYKRNCCWEGIEKESFHIENYLPVKKIKTEQDLEFPMDEWLKFFGLWVAEGCTYNYTQKGKYIDNISSISNCDFNMIQEINDTLHRWGFNSYIVTKRGTNKACYEIIMCNYSIFKYLSQFGDASQKFIPSDLKNLSSRQLKILLDAIIFGDGSASRKCIYTSSVKLVDDLTELILKTGGAPNISINHKKGSIGKIKGKTFIRNHAVYSVSYSSHHKEIFVANKSNRWIDYDGVVFCVEVPNHIIYVRKNNKMVWCGNSRAAQENWKGYATSIEGELTSVPYKGSVKNVFEELISGILSGMSYQNAKNLIELREHAEFIKITSAGYKESLPHGLL